MALKTIIIPSNTYQVGTALINSAVVPGEAVQAQITLDVSLWTDPAARMDIALEQSLNNGSSWVPGGATTWQPRLDGTFRSKGQILTSVVATFQWQAGVTNVRGSISISGASVPTSGTVVVS